MAPKRQPMIQSGSTLTKLLSTFADMRHQQAVRETAQRFGVTEKEVLDALAGNTFYVKFKSIPVETKPPPPSSRKR